MNNSKIMIRSYYYWTPEEDDIIKKYYPSEGISVKKRLDRERTSQSISQRAHRLGVATKMRKERKNFTPEEDRIIKEYFPSEGVGVASRLINRKEASIRNRARALDVQIANPMPRWDRNEEKILKKYYPYMGSKVGAMLPHRTDSSIRSHANQLGVKYIASAKRVNE